MGASAIAQALAKAFLPKPRDTPAQFGEQWREIKKSGRPGEYRISETPWAAKVFWALSDDSPFREVYVPKGTQLGFTEIGLIWIGHGATKGRSSLIIEPTEATAKKIAKTKWREFVHSAKPLRELFPGRSADTTLHFSSPSCDVIFAGSNSKSNFASITMVYAMADDYDRWIKELAEEGDPLTLLRNRIVAAGIMGKLFVPSSPTLHDAGIWPLWKLTEQQFFNTPCPCCRHKQTWLWENLKWEEGRPETVMLFCVACGVGSTEYDWKAHWGDGEWVATAESARADITGFHLSSLYAMLGTRTWTSIASEYEGYKRLGQLSNMTTFDNTVLGLPTKNSEDAVPVDELRQRLEADMERGVVPAGGLCLTAAIDYQGNRLEVFVYAWARRQERWLVDHVVIPRMKPGPKGKDVRRSAEELKADIRTLVQDRFWPHEKGGTLQVEMIVHDVADGPADVYDVIDLLPKDKNVGSLGLEGRGKTELFNPAKAQDIRRDGKVVKHGRMRMSINTYPAKTQWYVDLRREASEEGPSERFVHLPKWVDEVEGLLAQFVAEELRKSSRGRLSWQKTGRNEALDCAIMADGARYQLRTHKWKEQDWANREAMVDTQSAPPPPPEDEPPEPPPSAPTSSWVNAGSGSWINRR